MHQYANFVDLAVLLKSWKCHFKVRIHTKYISLIRNHCFLFESKGKGRLKFIPYVLFLRIYINQFISICLNLIVVVQRFHFTYYRFVTLHVENLYTNSRQWFCKLTARKASQTCSGFVCWSDFESALCFCALSLRQSFLKSVQIFTQCIGAAAQL